MASRIINIGIWLIAIMFLALSVGFLLYAVPINGDTTDISTSTESSYDGDIDESEVEAYVSEGVNDERSVRNTQPLTRDSEIDSLAQYKSDKMLSENYISHTSPDGDTVQDRFERFNIECSEVGENLAQTHYMTNVDTNYGGTSNYQTEEELAEGIVEQFMASNDHRDNLLSRDWGYHGVAMSISDNGKVYITHKFCDEIESA